MKFKFSVNILSLFLLVGSCFMMSALIPAYSFNDPVRAKVFFTFFPIVIFVISLLLFIKTRTGEQNISLKMSFIIVSFSWIAMTLLGAFPYIFISELSLTDAFFESMSGFTTTGASILEDVESHPYSLLYWRSLTNWLGGMGIIVLFLAIFSLFNFGSSNIYKAEVPGHKSDKLTSKVAETAKILWLVYILLTFILFVLLKIFGMSFFDAICHALTTIATGGFSTKNSSIADFGFLIQITITIFMFLAGCNFIWHVQFLRGKLFSYFKNEEFTFFFFITLFCILLLSLSVYYQGVETGSMTEILVQSSFQAVSLITTTGFTSTNYDLWPILAKFILFFTKYYYNEKFYS